MSTCSGVRATSSTTYEIRPPDTLLWSKFAVDSGQAADYSIGTSDRCIQIEIKFRMAIAGVDRLVTYHLEIEQQHNLPTVKREILRYKRGRHGSPFHFLDFRHGQGYAISNEEDFNRPDEVLTREEQSLDSPHILAIKGLGQFSKFKAASAFRQLIEHWHVSDFHIDLARGSKDAAGYDEHLSASGDWPDLIHIGRDLR